MKLAQAALITGLTTALLFGAAPDVSAQFQVGLQGTMEDIQTIDFGLGGRVGYFQRTSGIGVGFEASYNYYFPSCGGVDCDSSGGHAVILASQSVGLMGGSQPYLALGTRYQRLNLNPNTQASNHWGFAILFGSQVRSNDQFSPFFETGWSFMSGISGIFDLTLGVRYRFL